MKDRIEYRTKHSVVERGTKSLKWMLSVFADMAKHKNEEISERALSARNRVFKILKDNAS